MGGGGVSRCPKKLFETILSILLNAAREQYTKQANSLRCVIEAAACTSPLHHLFDFCLKLMYRHDPVESPSATGSFVMETSLTE